MELADLVATLSSLSDLEVSTVGDSVRIHIPAINDALKVSAVAVLRTRTIFAPNGDRALQLEVRSEEGDLPLILTDTDCVYPPATSGSVLDTVPYKVTGAPHLVAYSEMERDCERLAVIAEQGSEQGGDRSPDDVGGTFLLLRYFITGALRFGMRPVRAVAWWERAWAMIGDDIFLPAFRMNAQWDEVRQEAALFAYTLTPAHHPSTAPMASDGLVVADFKELEPLFTAVQLDDEFVSIWKSWIPIHPSVFATTLALGIPAARLDVSLYPGGAGTVELRLQEGEDIQALLQLRFSIAEADMHVDEIRIAPAVRGHGLFQRLLFNSDQLAGLLGLERMHVLATGVGAYALAILGHYPHPF